LSRNELALTICEHLRWNAPNGKAKIASCRHALEKMQKMGLLNLPELRPCERKLAAKPRSVEIMPSHQEPLVGSVGDVLPLELKRVTTKAERDLWNDYIERYHYLGYKIPVGAHLRYFIVSKKLKNQYLGCLLFSSSAWAIAPRDLWIGWRKEDRTKRLSFIVNNSRFLIFPWVNVESLASKVLAMAAKTLPDDWQEVYGFRPVLLETFVDSSRYEGTCYQAANWQKIGTTSGRDHSDRRAQAIGSVKTIYALPLTSDFRACLRGERAKSSQAILPTEFAEQIDDSLNIWEKIVKVLNSVCNACDKTWQKRRRVVDTLLLVLLIFRLVLSKNRQGYATTIGDLWDNCDKMNLTLPKRRPIAPSSLSAARQKLDENIFKTINRVMIQISEKEGPDDFWHGHRIFAVDGSRMILPRPLAKLGYDTSSGSHYPIGLMSALYQLKSKIPYDFDLVKHNDERICAIDHLASLRAGDVVVYDRGYFSYCMLHHHLKSSIHAVFRLSEQTFTEIQKFMQSEEVDKVVKVAPSQKDKKSKRGIKRKLGIESVAPLPVRLLKYKVKDTTFYLATTLFDAKYTADIFPDVYHGRWGIEELYKVSKVLIDVEDFHSQTERGVKQELYAHFALITMNRALSNQAESTLNTAHKTNSKDADGQTDVAAFHMAIKVNFKNCLAAVSGRLEGLLLGSSRPLSHHVHCTMNRIASVTQKCRPGRSFERRSMKPPKKWFPSERKRKMTFASDTPIVSLPSPR
jgi:hypothetical protein